MIDADTPLLLGSASPRRRELLADLGIPVRVRPASVDESVAPGEGAAAYLHRVVDAKLAAVGAEATADVGGLLVADTSVVVDDEILGKPADAREAAEMLRRLVGRAHVVMTRYAIARPGPERVSARTVETRVVMRGASAVSEYRGLPEQEAFDIEYWLLEEAKLQRMPRPKSLAGRIAIVTGGAGGIGSATAERFLAEGACVVLADIDAAALADTASALSSRFSQDVVRTVEMDVTSEDAVAAAYAEMAVEFGGLDILVSNAGIASSAPVEDTSLALWNRNMAILSTGYFLVSREAFRTLKAQGIGGAIVFIASKNGLAASPNASAYCTAKASEIHLARCLALEGASEGIRVNVVNPDAVLRGSKIWSGDWLKERAATYGKDKEGLEEHYRQRSLLKRSVLPEDIAEATYFFASDASAKSTGNIVNVDAGNVQAFTR